MSKIDKIYDELAIKKLTTKANRRKISKYAKRAYEACKPYLDDNMSIEQFIAFTASPSPGKSGIGEEAQFLLLKERNVFTDTIKLANSRSRSVRLYKDHVGNILCMSQRIAKIKMATNKNIHLLDKIKSLDGIAIQGLPKFLVLKTVDVGTFSDSEGGGQQTNVEKELLALIECIGNNNVLYYGKKIEIYILVDGRSSDNILASCKDKNKNPSIILGKCETI
jgi:hypothetical protein